MISIQDIKNKLKKNELLVCTLHFENEKMASYTVDKNGIKGSIDIHPGVNNNVIKASYENNNLKPLFANKIWTGKVSKIYTLSVIKE